MFKENKIVKILLALCLGLINAARGSGISGMKIPQIIAMALSAFIITESYIYTILFIIPVALIFSAGTGELMPLFKIEWRKVEFLMIFIYCIIFFFISEILAAILFSILPIYVIIKKVSNEKIRNSGL